jgi:hypothetical protein
MHVHLYPLQSDMPPVWHIDANGRARVSQQGVDAPHPDLEYLAQFLPPERRDPTEPVNANAYVIAHSHVLLANHYYQITAGVWFAQVAMLFFFLTASLTSAWAADYLVRSGRGLIARGLCYAELYLASTALLVAAILFAMFVWIVAVDTSPSTNKPPVWPFAVVFALAVAIATVAWTGVIRRWHPALRVAIYVAFLVAVYALFSQSL